MRRLIAEGVAGDERGVENTPLLYIGGPERAAIARLKTAAAAAPQSLAESAASLARRRRGDEVPDPAVWTIALRFGFFATYRVEDWPDGRWRRLSIRTPIQARNGRWPAIGVAAVLLAEFGFAATRLSENVVWRGKAGAGRVLHITERIGPLPDGAAAAPAEPEGALAAPDPGEVIPDDDDESQGEEGA